MSRGIVIGSGHRVSQVMVQSYLQKQLRRILPRLNAWAKVKGLEVIAEIETRPWRITLTWRQMKKRGYLGSVIRSEIIDLLSSLLVWRTINRQWQRANLFIFPIKPGVEHPREAVVELRLDNCREFMVGFSPIIEKGDDKPHHFVNIRW